MVERIVAGNGRVAWTVCLPRTEQTCRVDLAARYGVIEHGSIPPGLVGTNLLQLDMLQFKVFRILVGFGCLNNQLRVVAGDLVNDDLDLGVLPFSGMSRSLLPLLARRGVDSETVEMHRCYMHRDKEQSKYPGVEGELLDRNQRLASPASDHLSRGIDAQASTGNFESAQYGDVQVLQFNTAVEFGAQGFRDAALQDGTSPMNHHSGDNAESEGNNEQGRTNPDPHALSRHRCP